MYYLSGAEALRHAGYYHNVDVKIDWIDSELLTPETVSGRLGSLDGILVPGGFGERGIEGMILAARYAREHNLPFFGICLGMQVAAIDFARNVLKIDDADSGEFNEDCPHKIIDFMPDQYGDIPKGGTMRLGAYPCVIREGSLLEQIYGCRQISERHRHRYEFNNDYRDRFEEAGMTIAGTSPDGLLVESVTIPANAFFIGVQYHPEFKSRPNKAHPLFREFIKAAARNICNQFNATKQERKQCVES